jgi:hypothetical protein
MGHRYGRCGDRLVCVASCADTFGRFESEHAGIYILANSQKSLADTQKLVRGDLAPLQPIAHGRRSYARRGRGGGRSTQSFNNGLDCFEHAP